MSFLRLIVTFSDILLVFFRFFLLQVLKKKAIPGNFVSATMIMIMYIFYISPDQIFKETDSITSNVFVVG